MWVKDWELTRDTKVSSSVASSFPEVACRARENTDRFGTYGDMVASAITMATDRAANISASNLKQHQIDLKNPYWEYLVEGL